MNLIVIFGPPAVGKMTVGMELQKITGYKLFYNHMVIELIHNFFDFGEGNFWKIVKDFRIRLFQEISQSNALGLIFTYVWNFDSKDDQLELEEYCRSFGKEMSDVYFVELFANQTKRIERNKSELRLRFKKSKEDLAKSEKHLLDLDENERLNSGKDYNINSRHIKINNEEISAGDVAKMICKKFKFGEYF